ncbi:MAG: radical SAM protein [Truepera sp.]|nr:radical SAM protein [Truepera sp.]MBS3967517.1 radical SAM protein [Truepera sp.]
MYKRSRYTLQKQSANHVHLYNTLTGKGGRHPLEAIRSLRAGQGAGAEFDRLVADGHLVRQEVDEFAVAKAQQAAVFFRNDVLHLILFPTEQCNFRCVYCYEKFEHGVMRPEVIEGVKNLVTRRAAGLKELYVGWFGGEPLLAQGVVIELSRAFINLARAHGFGYRAHATTNGYFLTPELAPELLDVGLLDFQVTLDGFPRVHDAKRKLVEGGPTFGRIWENLIFLKGLKTEFRITLRINLDEENCPQTPAFIRQLGDSFGSDPRFELHLHPVGRWGGENDNELKIIDHAQGLLPELYRVGRACGLNTSLGAGLNPFGSVCYAAKPYSFAIRADGRVNKCTVALEDQQNQLGRILSDGTLLLDQGKFNSWVLDNALSDTGCQKCSLRPACQGAACPLERMNTGERPCPEVKNHFKAYLPLLLDEAKVLEVV